MRIEARTKVWVTFTNTTNQFLVRMLEPWDPQPRTALSPSMTSTTCPSPPIPHRQRIVPGLSHPMQTRHRILPNTKPRFIVILSFYFPLLLLLFFLLSFTFLHRGNWLHFRNVLAHHENRKIPILYNRIRHTHNPPVTLLVSFFFLLLSSLRYYTLSLSMLFTNSRVSLFVFVCFTCLSYCVFLSWLGKFEDHGEREGSAEADRE